MLCAALLPQHAMVAPVHRWVLPRASAAHVARRFRRVNAASELDAPETSESKAPATESAVLPAERGVPPTQTPSVPQAGGDSANQLQSMVEELFDSSKFGTRGEGWVAAQIAAIAVIVTAPGALTSLIDSLAALGMLAGGTFVAYALVHLGSGNLTPLPALRKEHELVTTGIYSYARHPMYGGVLLLCLGLAVVTHNETRLTAVAALWWILEQKVALEEGALSARFPEYAEYKAKTKKLIPFVY